jgi:hypothetical protein
MSREISLRIVLQNAVDGTIYGLQKGKGPDYETVQAQLGNGRDLTFDFTVHVKEANGPLPTIAGPFVQGPAGNRFIYIGIGSYAGQPGASWSGRMKVPLPEATFQNALSDEGTSFWSCTIPGRNEVGKPVFATVKPFVGWSVTEQSD